MVVKVKNADTTVGGGGGGGKRDTGYHVGFRGLRGLCALLLLLAACMVYAADGAQAPGPVMLEQGTDQYLLGLHTQYLEDATNSLTFEQVSSAGQRDRFIPNQQATPNFGFTRSTYWFRFRLHNRSALEHRWLLEIQYPVLDEIDVYQIAPDGAVSMQHSGDLFPFSQRAVKQRSFLFNVPLTQGDEREFLIRIKTESSMQVPLALWSTQAFLEKNHDEQYILGVYYGALLAMLLYNLLIFASIRDINYLYYSIYITGYILFQLSLNGLAFEYLWPELPWWASRTVPFFVASGMASIVQFTRSFLQLKTNMPRLDDVFKFFLVFFLLVAVGSLFLNYQWMLKIGTIATLIVSLCIFFAGFMCWRMRFKPATFFMLAWTALLLGMAAYIFKTYGLLPKIFLTEYGIQIGSFLEVFLLSFALAYRFRLLKDENEHIQHEAAETLEHRVEERTEELNLALDELSKANERLKELSNLDVLTGVKNRTFFNAKYEHEWKSALREKYSVAMLLIDIDHFKQINDTFGHLYGDEVLKQAAQTIQKNLKRPMDDVARYGGEEFAIILPRTDEEGAANLAEKIRAQIESLKIHFENKTVPITASIGVSALTPKESDDPEFLISSSDSALYEAKNGGRNQVRVYKKRDVQAHIGTPN